MSGPNHPVKILRVFGSKGASPKHVLITGATGAIGSALALEYAQPGRLLTLTGRRDDKLQQLAVQCRARGAHVSTRSLDLRMRHELRSWLIRLCTADTPDLLIAASGLNTHIGPQGEQERSQETEALIDVNVLAVMAMVDSVLPFMRRRGQGQIALLGSLAGYFGLPLTPTYCASKAALKAYGEALRGWLRSEGIRINVIMPGYISSPMCDAMPGPKPLLWTAPRAAGIIRRGLEQDKARIVFPFPLFLGVWLLSLLPFALSSRIARRIGYAP